MEVMLSMFAPALSEEGARFYIEQNGGRIELGTLDQFILALANIHILMLTAFTTIDPLFM